MCKCKFCKGNEVFRQRDDETSSYYVNCPNCGEYNISFKTISAIKDKGYKNFDENRWNVVNKLKRNYGEGKKAFLTTKNMESYLSKDD